MITKTSLLMCMLALLSGCAHISPQARSLNAEALALAAGWEKHHIQANRFTLAAFTPSESRAAQTLTIYIEGDGLAWRHRRLPSKDPTPINPLALKLALKDQHAGAYLARPCQYVQDNNRQGCEQRYWTHARFSEEVIDATDHAITVLKQQFNAQRLVLVGYSGGAAIAALVAARRSDVKKLVTVAGNLDHIAWTRLHNISPLTESLNPVDSWTHLQAVEQLHLIGANDKVVPSALVNSYQRAFPSTTKQKIRIIDGFDHHCCWVEQWPDLLR